MSPLHPISTGPVADTTHRLSLYLVCALLPALALFPPEARGEAAAGCSVLIFLLAVFTGRAGRPIPSPAGAGTLFLLAVLSWPLVLAAAAPGRAIPALAMWFLALTAGMSASRLPDRVRTSRWPGILLVLAGTFAACYGIWQRALGLDRLAAQLAVSEGNPAYRQAILDRLMDGRAFAGFTTPAALGAFLSLTVMVTVCFALADSRRKVQGLLAASILVQVGGLVSAASVTASLALAGALIAAFLLLLFRKGGKPALGIYVIAALFLVGLLGGVIALRGGEVLDLHHGNNPLRLRAGNMRIAAEITADHPWLGVGPGGYGEAYGSYMQEGDNESRHAHNLPLEMTAEFGILGGSVLGLLFFLVFLGPLFRSVRREAPFRNWRFGAAVGVAAFAIHNLADYTAYMPSLLWMMAVVCGFLTGDRPGPDARRRPGVPPGSFLPGLAFLAIAGAAMITAGHGLAWNARYSAQDAYASGDRRTALAGATRAVRLAPWDLDARRLQARLFLETGDTAHAAAAVEKAIELSPWSAAARHLEGVIRSRTGDVPGALNDLETAARMRPGRTDLRKEAIQYRRQVEGMIAAKGASDE